jgi:hypothetical protein
MGAIGLSILLTIGYKAFEELLKVLSIQISISLLPEKRIFLCHGID